MSWPNSIPPDLRRRIENVLTLQNHSAPEVWGEVRDWLIKHGVQAPDVLPEDERPTGPSETKRK